MFMVTSTERIKMGMGTKRKKENKEIVHTLYKKYKAKKKF